MEKMLYNYLIIWVKIYVDRLNNEINIIMSIKSVCVINYNIGGLIVYFSKW